MNRKRLMHTAREVLPFVEPEKLQMSSWVCGTSACAFGHECLSEAGRKAGLRLVSVGPYREPAFRGHNNIHAAASYYGIDLDTALWLFSPEAYSEEDDWKGNPNSYCQYECDHHAITPAHVAARIESLLACG